MGNFPFGYVLAGDTSRRDYTVVDFSPPMYVAADVDQSINFMEFVRTHFAQLVKGVPPECELYLIAGGHAHNPSGIGYTGLVPLLVLWLPPEKRANLPDWHRMIETIDKWCESLTFDEVRTILNMTYAPTWKQLLHVGKYPHCYIRK